MYSFVTPLIADTFICFGIGISLIKEPVELTASVEDTADVFFNALADDELAAALLLLVAVSGPAPRYVSILFIASTVALAVSDNTNKVSPFPRTYVPAPIAAYFAYSTVSAAVVSLAPPELLTAAESFEPVELEELSAVALPLSPDTALSPPSHPASPAAASAAVNSAPFKNPKFISVDIRIAASPASV